MIFLKVWLGGSPANTRTAYPFAERMKDAAMEDMIEPILRCVSTAFRMSCHEFPKSLKNVFTTEQKNRI